MRWASSTASCRARRSSKRRAPGSSCWPPSPRGRWRKPRRGSTPSPARASPRSTRRRRASSTVARTWTMLEGIHVLDLSRVIAGPYCATLMADLGADVIKVERPGRGDDLRAWRGDGMSATFAAINRNKRGIAVDLQHPEGARLAFELARRADVVVENFLPGVAERLGLGYQAVSAANPSVIYASVTGFGQTGPHARRAGYNTIAQGMSGIMALTGQPGSPPTKVGGSVADLAAAFLAFGAVNAALVHRLPTAEWVRRFEAAQVAAGPIYEFDEVFDDPQVQHLGLVTEVDQPGYGQAKMLAFPVRASATPATIRRPAPRLGEHTAEVLGELGLARAEIERLAASGVVALA